MLVNILTYPGMTMLDAIGPYEVLSRLPDARIQFVAADSKAITSDTGFMTFLPTCDLGGCPRIETYCGKADFGPFFRLNSLNTISK